MEHRDLTLVRRSCMRLESFSARHFYLTAYIPRGQYLYVVRKTLSTDSPLLSARVKSHNQTLNIRLHTSSQ